LPGHRRLGMVEALARIIRASVPEVLRSDSHNDRILTANQ